MTTSADTEQARTALELINEAIVRLRLTDPADSEAALLAAWHGFCITEAAGGLLAQDNPDDAVLARNARPVMAAVATRLREAPSLPYTDQVAEIVHGLIPGDIQAPVDDQAILYHDPDQSGDHSAAGVVRRAILALVLELNTMLPHAAEHAADPGDRSACVHGTRLAHELGRCWEGRLGSFLNNNTRDLTADRPPRRHPGRNTKRKRAKNRN